MSKHCLRPWFVPSLALALALASGAGAQPGGAASRPTPPAKLRNHVAAMVGDRAVLYSTLRESVETQLRQMPADDRLKESPERLEQQQLVILAQREALAQSARTASGETREQFDRIVREELERYQEQQIQDSGSMSELARELEQQGKSWEGERDRKESDFRRQLNIEFELHRRFRDQLALVVTPAEMLEYYQQNLNVFVRQGTVDLEFLRFQRGPDESTEVFGARVREAARRWAEPDSNAQLLQRELGASAHGAMPHNDSRREEFKKFAATAKLGEVAAIELDGRVWLLKVVRKENDRNDAFSDPKVQETIHGIIAMKRQEELHNRFRVRHERTLVFWPSWLALHR